MPAKSHPVFEEPANIDIPIWRYMDFTKFVSMLANDGIYFARSDCLGDPFEGAYSKFNLDKVFIEITSKSLGVDNLQAASLLKTMRGVTKEERGWVYVNCWHMSEHESAAMWKLYAQTVEAISIKSTFAKLKSVLPEEAFLGCVKYIDYETTPIPMSNAFYPFIHKRLSFEHEREVRALIQDDRWYLSWYAKNGLLPNQEPPKPPANGVWKNISLRELIETVHVAPTAPEWFKETVEKTLKHFGYSTPVVRSRLDDAPIW